MKKIINKIKLLFNKKNNISEKLPNNSGDLVQLIWLIEKLRRRDGCTMNELLFEAKNNFNGIDKIKHK